MKDKTIVIVLLLVSLMMFWIVPAFAFYHPSTGLEDNLFEDFGPRIDRILIKMYGSLDAEIAALQAGEIDITDWPLTKSLVDALTGDPNVVVLSYGGESGYYTLNFNNNNDTYLGNPPNPSAPNPVYPNPMAIAVFRQCVSTTINNTYLCSVLAGGMYEPIYTPIPAYMTFWAHPDIRLGGALENLTWPYDGPTFVNSNAKLDANHFPLNLSTGFRYWDRNANGVEDAGEAFQLKIYTRADILRRSAGDMEAAGLTAMQINFARFEVSGSQAAQTCMIEQNYHSYTCGWINLGPDGDYLYDLYSYDNYWWDGSNGPANWAAIGKYNSAQNAFLLQLKLTSDAATAQAAAFNFEVSFAADACEKPLASTSAPKAFSKFYSGGNDGVIVSPDDGENEYRGHEWDNIVNERGFGENSWWSTLNMHPTGDPMGDGSHMTVRYGWEQTGMPKRINPIFSSWYWESEIWCRVIDGGASRNPMTSGPVEVPQLIENWTQGTWVDPVDGITKAAITATMRPDALWNDGQPCTIDDFIYTLVTLYGELYAKGCIETWWQPTLDQIAGYYKLDDYSATILMKTNSFLATTWIVSNMILPKHWWQPFIAANTASVIMGDLGTGLIGTGPFLYTSLTPNATATMVRNPLYDRKDPVRATISFTATDGSSQITPNKIKVAADGDGHVLVIVLDKNEDEFNSAYYTETVTYQRIAPDPVGLVAQVINVPVGPVAPGETVIGSFNLTLPPGEHKITVTKDISSEPWVGEVVVASENVKVTVAGDINGDWIVDIFDIAPIALAFGSIRGGAGYNALADINRDGIIDIFDIVQVALVFGWAA